MMDLQTLRSFLRLDARAEVDGIPAAEVLRQEQTVLAALQMLATRPGVALADEVGMGKTYEALGIAAAVRHANPQSRIVVVTPSPELTVKWSKDIVGFRAMYDFGDRVCPTRTLRDFVEAIHTEAVVLAPVTMFRTGRGQDEQAHVLALYCRWKDLPHQTAHAIFRRVFPERQAIPDVDEGLFLDAFGWDDVAPHLALAFRRGDRPGRLGLDDLYAEGNLDAFWDTKAVRGALYRARFELCGCLLPKIDLLIVDEAHKLRNPGSLQTSAMRHVFEKGFDKALLLTATPFQLDVGELREIFSLFAQATTAPTDVMREVDSLLDHIRHYQERYDEFQQTWLKLDPLLADEFSARYEAQGAEAAFDDASLRIVCEHVRTLRALKGDLIEPGLRSWMIRSLRPEKRDYRRSEYLPVRASGPGVLPFLLYERFIAELFRQNRRTHKASVEINMVSSYAAAAAGTLMQDEEALPASADAYRALLRDILPAGTADASGHPKVACVVAQALEAALAGEKTLVFCARTETVRQLQSELVQAWEAGLVERWREVYPGAQASDVFDTHDDETRHRGRHSLLQARFHRPQDALYLALREPCLREPWLAERALQHLHAVVAEANALLAAERVGKTAAERVDYAIARRCIRHAAVNLWEREHLRSDEEALQRQAASAEDRATQDHDEPLNAAPTWAITEPLARTVIGSGASLWSRHAELLARFPVHTRERLVERLAHYLTSKQVPFLSELLSFAAAKGVRVDPVESAGLLDVLPAYWLAPGGAGWVERLGEFMAYVAKQSEEQQVMIFEDMGKTLNGGFVRHTLDADSRERLRQLFNTPLFPMVLVANAVMQEGLDLHRQCRRVIHHDLEWNPAQVEQRIGRVDRLGSLTSRLRAVDPSQKLHVLYPAIRSTIDERLYRTVKMREKWLEFLLGAQPQFESFTFSDETPRPLPERLARELAIQLAPMEHMP
ncbi:helicase-related protein [Sphaerotilaceae bacterium SBD11-9]